MYNYRIYYRFDTGKEEPMAKVFIDGQEGTTGLKIVERLMSRPDMDILFIDPDRRKDPEARLKKIKEADITFLCLPDAASREIAALAPRECRILDTSTAHRTNPDWVYGFPELAPDQRRKIRESSRVAVPGCHASGFIALVKPLVEMGIISDEMVLSCTSLTGYSGGGKKMIAEYEQDTDGKLRAPRMYGLSQEHKHLPEMMSICGLKKAPLFFPIVSSYYSGMVTTVSLTREESAAAINPETLKEIYRKFYPEQPMIRLIENLPEQEGAMIRGDRLSGQDDMEILVTGNPDRMAISASFDNLGKGASGAAIQCMNIMLGLEETLGLVKG